MPITLRPATDADLPALVHVLNAAHPDHPQTLEGLTNELAFLRGHAARPHHADWVAVEDGHVVGIAGVTQNPGMLHPDRYYAEVTVHPDAARRGIGTRLAQTLEGHLRDRGAREVLAGAYETCPHALRMLEARGFAEAMRFLDNVLTLDTFDPAGWVAERALPGGVRAVSLADLSAEVGEDAALRAFHAGFAEARADVPRNGEASPLSLEDLRQRLSGPGYFPQGILLAVTAEGEVVALSELWTEPTDPARLNIGLTGTSRAWRRQGLALALKLRGLELAQARGVREIWTGNATTNAPMLALNTRLGFRPRSAYIEYKWGGV